MDVTVTEALDMGDKPDTAGQRTFPNWKVADLMREAATVALADALAARDAELAAMREALEDTQATLSAIRASLVGDPASRDLQHIFGLAGEQMVRNRAALGESKP